METTKIVYCESEPPLDKIQKIINGYFMIIHLPNNKLMYVNENGIPLKLPINKEATKIVGFEVYGDVLIVG